MTQWNDGREPESYPSYEVIPPAGSAAHAPPYQAPYAAQPGYGRAAYAPPPQLQPMAPAPPPPGGPRRNTAAVALIASLAVLAVLVVAIVVVLAVRKRDTTTATPGAGTGTSATPASDAQAGPVDACLIGNWKQTQYTATFDLGGVTDANKVVGTVKLTGGGRLWKIGADGKATEDFTSAKYSGRTTDGRTVDMMFNGQNDWTLKTSNHQLLFVSTASNLEMLISVNGKLVQRDKVEPHNNPQPYTCATNSWSTTSLTDSTASSKQERV